MAGIKAYGTYVPFHRLTKATVAAAYGGFAKKGEKAVAYYDEDSLTMAVAAAMEATEKLDTKALQAVSFATTTAPLWHGAAYRRRVAGVSVRWPLLVATPLQRTDRGGRLSVGYSQARNRTAGP